MIAIFRFPRNSIRSRLDKIRQFWSDEGPGGDCFWLLDLLTLVGGIKSATTCRFKWGHYIRYLSNSVYMYLGFVFLLQVIHSLHHQKDDVTLFVFECLKLFIYIVAVTKILMLSHLQKPIAAVRNFIIGNSMTSGDKSFDELEQRKFNHRARTTIQLSIGMILSNVVAFSVPNSATERVLGLPPLLQGFRQPMSSILRYLAIYCIPLGLVTRFFTNFTTLITLLLGMRAKLRMLAYRYAQILVQPEIDVDYTLERMNRDLRATLDQQLEYWR
nr:uncharacterized protein LOC115263541 [Aedes albopictus]